MIYVPYTEAVWLVLKHLDNALIGGAGCGSPTYFRCRGPNPGSRRRSFSAATRVVQPVVVLLTPQYRTRRYPRVSHAIDRSTLGWCARSKPSGTPGFPRCGGQHTEELRVMDFHGATLLAGRAQGPQRATITDGDEGHGPAWRDRPGHAVRARHGRVGVVDGEVGQGAHSGFRRTQDGCFAANTGAGMDTNQHQMIAAGTGLSVAVRRRSDETSPEAGPEE